MWTRHFAFIREVWFNWLDQARSICNEKSSLTTWKIPPFAIWKIQPWPLSWKLSAKYFMSADFWCFNCSGPPAVHKSHILPGLFWVWLFYTFSRPRLTRGNKSSAPAVFWLIILVAEASWSCPAWRSPHVSCPWQQPPSNRFPPLDSISVVSSILRQNLSRFAYFEVFFSICC